MKRKMLLIMSAMLLFATSSGVAIASESADVIIVEEEITADSEPEKAAPEVELVESVSDIPATVADDDIIDSGTCGDDLTWVLNSNGTLTISGSGDMNQYDSAANIAPWYSNRTSVNSIVIGSGVTSIGNYAFYSCTNITSVSIADSVTSIGYGSFYNCLSLEAIVLPDSVTTIGNSAFYNCRSLITVDLPKGITTIASNLFYDCDNLVSVSIPSSVITIGANSFYNCNDLTNINIPSGIEKIGSCAFYNCSSLISITIPEGVTEVSNGTFYGCSSLIDINLPSSITTIEYEAFRYCSSLVNVTLPDRITSIGATSFAGCTSLVNINIPKNLTVISENLFSGCSSLVKIEIPEGVITIKNYAFNSCSSLTDVTISNGVVSIESNAFTDCESLKGITYTGTKAQWSLVDKQDDLNYRPIYCSDGIVQCDISEYAILTLSYDDMSLTFDRTAKTPVVTAGIGTVWYNIEYYIEEGTDYTVSYDNNVNAGTATVTVTGIGDFTGSQTVNFTIDGIPTYACNMTLEYYSTTYDGTEKTPTVTITYGDMIFVEGTDYEVSYSNNIEVGSATVTVSGLGNIDGTMWTGFTIKESSVIEPDGEREGTCGENLTWVLDSDGTLTISGSGEMTDWNNRYQVPWYSYSASITSIVLESGVTTIGNYAFYNCENVASVTIPDGVTTIGTYVFNGCYNLTSITIPASVTSIGDYLLGWNESIKEITYSGTIEQWNSISGATTTNLKYYPIICTDGIITRDINDNTIYTDATSDMALLTRYYTGEPRTLNVSIYNECFNLIEGTDFEVTYSNNINAGTATAVITGIGNYTGTTTVYFPINTFSIWNCSATLSRSEYSYDGTAKTPTVILTYYETILVKDVDFTVEYSNNIEVGIATATITGIGNYHGTVYRMFVIDESETGTESESEAESESEEQTETGSGSESGSQSESESDKQNETEKQTENEKQNESETDTNLPSETEVKNGLVLNEEDGIWYYYNDDVIDTTFTGIADYNGGSFFVANGVLCSDAHGLNLYDEKWYFLAYGQVQTQYTGLALYDGEWFYITEGILDTSVTGLVPYDGAIFLVVEGHLQTNYNGLWQYSSSIGGDDQWYFIGAGMLQNVSQVVMYDGEWFVVEHGMLDSDYNGTIEYDGATFAVVAGQLYSI